MGPRCLNLLIEVSSRHFCKPLTVIAMHTLFYGRNLPGKLCLPVSELQLCHLAPCKGSFADETITD